MKWKNLSEEAKSIIEWVVNPFSNLKEVIEINIGEIFHRNCPKPCVVVGEPLKDVEILVTEELYKEIFKYVAKQEDMEYEQSVDRLIFRLKDEVEV